MRIGPMQRALVGVARLELALRDCAAREWPCTPGSLPRERALAMGALELAEAPFARVGGGALDLVEAAPGDSRPGGWRELELTDAGDLAGATLACADPQQALGWYRGLGLAGQARQVSEGAIEVTLPGGQRLRLASIRVAPPAAAWRPRVISFARLDQQGRPVLGLRPRVLAGLEGETIELL